MNYAEERKDPRWQRRRSEIYDRANWRCEYCGRADKQLQVHHVHYINGRKPWEYEDNLLLCLCDPCHEEKTESEKEMIYALKVRLRMFSGRRMLPMLNQIMAEAMEELA